MLLHPAVDRGIVLDSAIESQQFRPRAWSDSLISVVAQHAHLYNPDIRTEASHQLATQLPR
jgi:hypothetical protein